MHGHMMYSDSLGAAAGFAPERSSLTGGVPSVSNAGVVGGVIHRAAVLWVAHVRLRSVLVALYQSLSASQLAVKYLLREQCAAAYPTRKVLIVVK